MIEESHFAESAVNDEANSVDSDRCLCNVCCQHDLPLVGFGLNYERVTFMKAYSCISDGRALNSILTSTFFLLGYSIVCIFSISIL